jgi:hypothetical protein
MAQSGDGWLTARWPEWPHGSDRRASRDAEGRWLFNCGPPAIRGIPGTSLHPHERLAAWSVGTASAEPLAALTLAPLAPERVGCEAFTAGHPSRKPIPR